MGSRLTECVHSYQFLNRVEIFFGSVDLGENFLISVWPVAWGKLLMVSCLFGQLCGEIFYGHPFTPLFAGRRIVVFFIFTPCS